MSILNKKFIETISNKPNNITYFSEYEQYLKYGVKKLLDAELLSHIFEGGGSDLSAFLLYKYEDKYIFIEICMGTCSGCKRSSDTYNSIIDGSLEKCYISTNLEEIENYYLTRLCNLEYDTEINKRDYLYYIYPNRAF
jgi:Fe-S cluster biogenesis protein NfuA